MKATRLMSASKKLKLDSGEAYGASFSQSFLSEVNAEVQLDIALRERLADTLESRIVWASALKESLKNGACYFPLPLSPLTEIS